MNQNFLGPSRKQRPNSKNQALNKGSKSPRWQEEEHRGKEDLSPLLQLIIDNQLFNQNPELDKIFGFYQIELESKLEKIGRFLSHFRREDRQQAQKLSTICALLTSKGVGIDSSELGIQLLSGKPIFVDHFLDTTSQKNLKQQVVKILQTVHPKDEKSVEQAMQKLLPQAQAQYTSIYDNLHLTEQGRVVQVHKNGFFAALAPFCYPSSVQVTRGALHIMEWGNNLLLVDLSRKNLSTLRSLYERKINILLISQVNWTYKLSSSFGNKVIFPQECLIDKSIQKMASVILQKKVEAKMNQLIQSQMTSQQLQRIVQEEDLSASRVQQLSLNLSLRDILKFETKDPNQLNEAQLSRVTRYITRNVNPAYRQELWRFQWIYPETLALMMRNYKIGIIIENSIEVPIYQNLIGSLHCITCGQYPIQGIHQCTLQIQVLMRND